MEVEAVGSIAAPERAAARNGGGAQGRQGSAAGTSADPAAGALLGPPGPQTGPGPSPASAARGPLASRLRPVAVTQFDAVLVSDAGAKLSTHRDSSGGGLVRTAMRASDILMDRVWQLEKEIFGATPGFLFAPIHRIVELDQDPHALLPVVQRQVIGIWTDLDRLTPLKIRCLVQHGYSVARQACRARSDVFGT
jgi:hypothetical protein